MRAAAILLGRLILTTTHQERQLYHTIFNIHAIASKNNSQAREHVHWSGKNYVNIQKVLQFGWHLALLYLVKQNLKLAHVRSYMYMYCTCMKMAGSE